jgi:hypothetical protein
LQLPQCNRKAFNPLEYGLGNDFVRKRWSALALTGIVWVRPGWRSSSMRWMAFCIFRCILWLSVVAQRR